MAEGWKQILEDLRGALGLPARPRRDVDARVESEQASDETLAAAPPALTTAEPAAIETLDALHDDGARPADFATAETDFQEEARTEAKPLTPRQKAFSYTGLAVTLLAALGIGWYVYFGGPQPPAPNVVATFDGGQITVEQVHEHMTRLGLDPLAHPAQEEQEAVPVLAYESYRITVEHMILDELVRRWAARQQMDRDAKLTDAMRHVSESVTLEEWIAEIHQDELTAAVRESDIQAYYETNRESFGSATLTEVRNTIRETLAHQNQEQFFADYVANLRHEPWQGGLVDLGEVTAHLRERLPEDAIVTNGAGNFSVWVHRFYQFRRYRTQLGPTSGAMGYGVPAAVAAKLVHPERLVVCFTGDGDFLMTGQELATAVQYELPLVILLANNGMYATIRMHQERRYPGRVVGTDLQNPDFAAYARAFGAHGEVVERTEDFPEAFERARQAGRPALLELRVDPEQITPRATIAAIRDAARRS